GSGSIDPRAEIFKRRFSPIIVLVSKSAPAKRVRQLRGIADEVAVFGKTDLAFRSALRWLNEKWGVKRLLCEGGGGVHEGIIRADLLDELHLTICPAIFGGRTAPTLSDGRGFKTLASAKRLRLVRMRRVGNESFMVFRRA
ncbi:MAG: dihydrofolate reductase family protein, partial [Limisphaerales bacterium]